MITFEYEAVIEFADFDSLLVRDGQFLALVEPRTFDIGLSSEQVLPVIAHGWSGLKWVEGGDDARAIVEAVRAWRHDGHRHTRIGFGFDGTRCYVRAISPHAGAWEIL